MSSKRPCPTINVTEPGKFTRKYYYLDTLQTFLPEYVKSSMKWGGCIFDEKYPHTNTELYINVN